MENQLKNAILEEYQMIWKFEYFYELQGHFTAILTEKLVFSFVNSFELFFLIYRVTKGAGLVAKDYL